MKQKHNGFLWEVSDGYSTLIGDSHERPVFGTVSVSASGRMWKGSLYLGKDDPWFNITVMKDSKEMVMAMLELMYGFIAEELHAPTAWIPETESTMTRETSSCKGTITQNSRSSWKVSVTGKSSMDTSVKSKEEAKLIADSLISLYRR